MRRGFLAFLASLALVLGGCGFVGLQNGGMLQWEPDAQLGRDLDAMATMGAGWVRLGVNWDHVQAAGPTAWDWGNADRTIHAALARGLHVLAQAEQAPAWARVTSCQSSLHCPPANPADYARFMSALATRYASQGVHAYEVWNEPNNPAFWIGGPDAAAYTSLLVASYAAIHGADAQAVVVSGGLAPHGDLHANPSDPQAPLNYVKAMYAAGAHGHFDALGWHPYPPLGQPPDACCVNWNAYLQVPQVHDLMTLNGDGGLAVWGTEFGIPTGTTATLQQQADWMVRGVGHWVAWSQQRLTGPLFIFQLRDNGTDPTDWHANLGLQSDAGTPKPAYDALRHLLTGTP